MDIREAKRIDDLEAELKARGEILDAITKNLGTGNSWIGVADLDWRQRARDFANDGDSHLMTHKAWSLFKGTRDHAGVVLFLQANFVTAYFDDARIIWEQMEDELPAYHVMVKSDPPHRTVIHLLHLVNWIVHLAGMCMPVEIVDMQFVEPDGE